MKKLLLSTIFAVCALSASAASYAGNSDNPNALLTSYGPWVLCEADNPPGSLCTGFRAGQESYLLLLRATHSETTVFHYVVQGVRADGQKLVTEGVSLRNDFNGMTAIVVSLGAPIADAQVTVQEL